VKASFEMRFDLRVFVVFDDLAQRSLN